MTYSLPATMADFKVTEDHRRFVMTLTAAGVKQADIAACIEHPHDKTKTISAGSLRSLFRAELDTGAAKMLGAVTAALFKNALLGNVAAQIFILKCRGGWKPPDHQGQLASGSSTTEHVLTKKQTREKFIDLVRKQGSPDEFVAVEEVPEEPTEEPTGKPPPAEPEIKPIGGPR